MNGFVKVGTKKDFAAGRATGIEMGDRRICIIRMGEKFYALTDRCSHAESLLSPGDVEEAEIVCPLHGARFSIETGEALTFPATRPVTTHEVKVEGDNIFVKLRD